MPTIESSPKQKLDALRDAIKEADVQAYIIPRADEFLGEFVAAYAERLQFLTGFTGSGGLSIVLEDKAAAFTDGRYMIQIKQEVDPALYEYLDMTRVKPPEWLKEHFGDGVLGYDPKLHTMDEIQKYEALGIALKPLTQNLMDQIWEGQPETPKAPVVIFPDAISGQSSAEKCEMLAEKLRGRDLDSALIALPDSIAWMLNVRGGDVANIPYILSYALLQSDGQVQWFVNPDRVTNDLPGHIHVRALDVFEGELPELIAGQKVLLDSKRAPIFMQQLLDDAGASIVAGKDPCVHPKSLKTVQEQEALKKAHILDGAALVTFLHWFDTEGQGGGHSEYEIAQKLEEFRRNNSAHFQGNSFPAICGFGANGAIIHYRAQPDRAAIVEGNGLLLLDSGGQYAGGDVYGTTDITRTFLVGEASEEERQNFTRVLRGNIAVSMARFPAGTNGAQIDAYARQPLWNAGLDFAHGTGHGVGCYLQVHEEAASISPRGKDAFEAGMLISNEPGYYKEGAYGIRIENLILVQKTEEIYDATGRAVLEFETVSFAPIDRRLIVPEMLSREERAWLNRYHAEVFEKLSPHLEDDVKNWLAEMTAEI